MWLMEQLLVVKSIKGLFLIREESCCFEFEKNMLIKMIEEMIRLS